MSKKKVKEGELGTPQKLVSIWTNSVYNQAGQPPTRGLGGRIYFYDKDHKPVQVEGQLVVYAYDDSSPENKEQQEANRKFVFSPEQVTQHFSPSEFGPSYSFWIPWDSTSNEMTELSVLPVFTDSQGRMVAGDQARHILPGKSRSKLAESNRREKATEVATADYRSILGERGQVQTTAASAFEVEEPRSGMKTETIEVPPSMSKLLLTPQSSARGSRPTQRPAPNQAKTSEDGDGNATSRGALPTTAKQQTSQSNSPLSLARPQTQWSAGYGLPKSPAQARLSERPSLGLPLSRRSLTAPQSFQPQTPLPSQALEPATGQPR